MHSFRYVSVRRSEWAGYLISTSGEVFVSFFLYKVGPFEELFWVLDFEKNKKQNKII